MPLEFMLERRDMHGRRERLLVQLPEGIRRLAL